MNLSSMYSESSKKSFIIFLIVVIFLLLGVIAYIGLYAKDLEREIVTDAEAVVILDALPDNPDANGMTPADKAALLKDLGSRE